MPKTIKILTSNNDEYEVKLVCAFSNQGNNYIIYTKDEKDSDNHVTIYTGRFNNDNNSYKILALESDSQWNKIKEIMRKMSNCEEMMLMDDVKPVEVKSPLLLSETPTQAKVTDTILNGMDSYYNKKEESYVLDNFDKIFANLINKVDNFDNVLTKINYHKTVLKTQNNELEKEKKILAEERKKIEIQKQQIKDSCQKLQEIINSLTEKIKTIE
ncbi:MAG: DUF1292 domain-containing protein [bacterium]|nr:DUF1292 domain-containing protein [bacterium]